MPFPVSITTLSLTDPTRLNWQSTAPRPLVTDIWYPAARDVPQEEILIGSPDAPLFTIGRGTRDAKMTTRQDKFPLIMLSHGTGGSAMSVGWFATALARAGYIVAGVNHHGNTAQEPYVVQGFTHMWERPRDISKVITQLLRHPMFGARIANDQIGAAGFSFGGYTVVALAGGITDLQLYIRRLKQRGMTTLDIVPPEFPDRAELARYFENLANTNTEHTQSFRDERIKAGFAMAPVLGEAFQLESLKKIQIPLEIIVGASDDQAPPEPNAEYLAKQIPNAALTILPAPAAHYIFLDECTDNGKKQLPRLCVDAGDVDRAAIHARVNAIAKNYFDHHLRHP